ncbi:hypothetical protein Lal_00038615 [Lupinus albus]|nr:hypothetical protein Lal_00038615 [Lupinus albus]
MDSVEVGYRVVFFPIQGSNNGFYKPFLVDKLFDHLTTSTTASSHGQGRDNPSGSRSTTQVGLEVQPE